MTVEEKVLQKYRKILIADTELNMYVKKRIYPSHVSTIKEPEYPCISLHLLGDSPYLVNYICLSIQIDVWLPADKYAMRDILIVRERLRILLHKPDEAQSLNDVTIDITFAKNIETKGGTLMHEKDTNLLHYPVIYEAVAK